MKEIEHIKRPVSGAFKQFKNAFSQSLSSEVKSIRSAIDALHHSSGKHIRPLLLLLSADACGQVTPDTIQSAVLLELLHTASLIHDDVVDDTRQRRGAPSLNTVHGNSVAVLVGDFILSSMMLRALETVDKQIVGMIATLCRNMVEGEIKQLDNTGEMVLSEPEYFSVLEKKTAGLLSTCTEIGAITAGAPHELQVKCRMFGDLLGLCFQIRDDIFDYFDNTNIGKPSGNDIREGKVTLPLLYALESSSAEEKAPYLQMLHDRRFSPENIAALIRFAKDRGGIEYAESRMNEYKRKAVEIILTLPDTEAKNSLLSLADFIVTRTK
jgi:octaprenyl-diphosphate synthase